MVSIMPAVNINCTLNIINEFFVRKTQGASNEVATHTLLKLSLVLAFIWLEKAIHIPLVYCPFHYP
jgi:hypothetical protein